MNTGEYGEPWRLCDGRICVSETSNLARLDLQRAIECVNFCAGAPSTALKPRGLIDSFRPLADGSVTDCITMQQEIDGVREANKLLVDAGTELAERLENANKEIVDLKSRLEDSKKAIELLKASVASKERELDALRKAFADSLYRNV